MQELPSIRAGISCWWGLWSPLPPRPARSVCILLPETCGKPQCMEKPQGWNKAANSFHSSVRNSTGSSGAVADALFCPRGRALLMLSHHPMPSLFLVAPVDPRTSPSRTCTHWADAWHGGFPSAWHGDLLHQPCRWRGERGELPHGFSPPLALHPPHQESILEHHTQPAPEGSAGVRKDWDFPASPAFTELHVPLCLQRGTLG